MIVINPPIQIWENNEGICQQSGLVLHSVSSKKKLVIFCISPSDLHVQCSIEDKFVVYIAEEKHLLYKIVQYTFNKSAVFNRARISFTFGI